MEVIGSIYTEVSDDFQKGIIGGGISRCVKTEKHDLGVVLMNEVRIGNIYGFDGGNYAGNVYDKNNCSPTIRTYQGGNQQPCVVAMRGRNPDNLSDRSAGSPTEQRLEVNTQGTSNCLTSVHKDNLVMENVIAIDEQNMSAKSDVFGTLTTDGSSPKHNNRVAIKQNTTGKYIYPKYRIRKLTPRECGRLMGVSDEDISKMAAVNSDSQLYKQFGNSIVVDVMCAMFKNLNINQS